MEASWNLKSLGIAAGARIKIMSKTITRMSEFKNDANLCSPQQALEDALREITEVNRGAFNKDCTKLLVLAVDDSSGSFQVSFIQAGMKMSECISLCEIAKLVFMREMNYV